MNEELKNILSRVDHTLLAQSATWNEIKAICDDGIKYGCASVCIPASYVKQAAEYVDGKIAVCTVIGFPNGYDTTAAKCFEAADAVKNGASEVDMVINIGWVKDGLYDKVLEEIKAIKGHCDGRLLKVIIETCLLTDAAASLRQGTPRPRRSAPRAMKSLASFRSAMPPAALIFTWGATWALNSATSSRVAPPPPKPVDVLM